MRSQEGKPKRKFPARPVLFDQSVNDLPCSGARCGTHHDDKISLLYAASSTIILQLVSYEYFYLIYY